MLYSIIRHKELPIELGVPGDLGTRLQMSKVKRYTQSATGTTEEIPFIRNIHDTCNILSVGRILCKKASQNCLENHMCKCPFHKTPTTKVVREEVNNISCLRAAALLILLLCCAACNNSSSIYVVRMVCVLLIFNYLFLPACDMLADYCNFIYLHDRRRIMEE